MARGQIRCVLALMLVPLPAATAELTLAFSGAGPTGQVRALVFADADAFTARQRPVAALVLTPRDGAARATVSELPPGTYAVAAFQDVNGNQTLDSTWLGIPSEPTGFSRHTESLSGPPDYAQVAVELPAGGLILPIRLR